MLINKCTQDEQYSHKLGMQLQYALMMTCVMQVSMDWDLGPSRFLNYKLLFSRSPRLL